MSKNPEPSAPVELPGPGRTLADVMAEGLKEAGVGIPKGPAAPAVAPDARLSEGMTPEEANKQITKIMAAPAYFDAKHPEHAETVKEVERLFKMVYPTAESAAEIEEPSRPALDPKAPFPEGMSPELANAMAEAMTPPATPEGYEISFPKLPPGVNAEDVEYDRELDREARKWFHGAGLNQGQVNSVLTKFHAESLNPAPVDPAADALLKAQTEAALRDEWGGDYDRKTKAAQAAVRKIGGEELADILDRTQLGNDPEIIKMFVNFAEKGARL